MYDVIIIGCGPAGMTAAIYACRAGAKVLIIEGEGIGGQIAFSPKVENFPAFPSAPGAEFAEKLYEQVCSFGAETEIDTVTSVEKKDGYFSVNTDGGSFDGKSVIIATGLKHRTLGVDGEEELVGNGISYCALCDGDFYRDKVVAVVGGGNTALQEAIYLSSICSEVYLIHRRDEYRADSALVAELDRHENIMQLKCFTVSEFIKSGEGISGLVLKSTDGEKKLIECLCLFVAVGEIPQNGVFADLVETDKNGYIISGEDSKTNVDGLFVCGDCRTKQIRQLTTAVADGAVAGTAAAEWAKKYRS